DGAPALALGTEKGDPDIMKLPPRSKDEPIIDSEMRLGLGIQTVVTTAVTLRAYILGQQMFPLPGDGELPTASTMAIMTVGLCELVRAYTARSEHYSMFYGGLFSNKNMNVAVLISTVLLLIVVFFPPLQGVFDTTSLTWLQWEIVLPLALLPAVAAEITKW